MDERALLIDSYQKVPHVFFAGVLDSVKNRLLSFILDLQDMNATPEALNDGSIAPEAIRNSFNINITNSSNNVIAVGENVHQTVGTVQKGDVNSLLDYFRTQNVNQQDLDDLRIAVSAEPHASNGSFGPRVRAWLGTMVSKSVSGVWHAGVADASTMLVEALQQYYGG